MQEEQNLILSLNSWRIVSDEVAAFSITKENATEYRVFVVLKTGFEIEEILAKDEAFTFGKKYIARMNEVYGLKMIA